MRIQKAAEPQTPKISKGKSTIKYGLMITE